MARSAMSLDEFVRSSKTQGSVAVINYLSAIFNAYADRPFWVLWSVFWGCIGVYLWLQARGIHPVKPVKPREGNSP